MTDMKGAGVPTPPSIGAFSPNVLEYMGILKEQADPKEVIERYARALRGEVYDENEGRWYVPDNVHPLMNEQGRAWVITYLTGLVSSVSTLTKSIEDEIPLRLYQLNSDIADDLCILNEEFGIDVKYIQPIAKQLELFAEAALYRSADALWMKLLKEVQQVREVQAFSPTQEKRGFLSKLFPFGK